MTNLWCKAFTDSESVFTRALLFQKTKQSNNHFIHKPRNAFYRTSGSYLSSSMYQLFLKPCSRLLSKHLLHISHTCNFMYNYYYFNWTSNQNPKSNILLIVLSAHWSEQGWSSDDRRISWMVLSGWKDTSVFGDARYCVVIHRNPKSLITKIGLKHNRGLFCVGYSATVHFLSQLLC